ncbi:(deoxy)nucleoside triphosphate pyrophosphohydrolase [Treponema sp.]|uniref:(deoxy)nucleoside triphosphate pyrophosphohydrolase n=1 Tax=Treponema sp. TaxID=166 RepID=UPI00388EE000
MSNVSIACIAFNQEGKVLIAHRNPTGQMGNRWEFPGGKVEDGEEETVGIVREFQEEFGVEVKVGEYIADAEFEHNGKKRLLHAYRIYVPHDGMTERYVLTEHTEYRWVDLAEIGGLDFVDSDLLIYPAVKKYAESL